MLLPRPVIHGLYVLCYLSRQKKDVVVAAKEVAEKTDVPPEQAAKILQALGVAGLVVAHRGRRGGYTLARPLEEITLADVFSAIVETDGLDRLRARSCPVAPAELCSAHDGLMRVHESFWALAREETLASLLGTTCQEESTTGE